MGGGRLRGLDGLLMVRYKSRGARGGPRRDLFVIPPGVECTASSGTSDRVLRSLTSLIEVLLIRAEARVQGTLPFEPPQLGELLQVEVCSVRLEGRTRAGRGGCSVRLEAAAATDGQEPKLRAEGAPERCVESKDGYCLPRRRRRRLLASTAREAM